MGKLTKNKSCTKYFSSRQEDSVSKFLGGRTQPGSGSAKFYAGDVVTNDFLIECKTTTKPKESFSIKKDWILKNDLERMSLGKPYSALAFQFAPDSPNYYVINESLFKKLLDYMERECE